LFLIPSLIEQGLFKTKEVYQSFKQHYYSIESVILTLAIMALLRIKNPEQLKQCKPGEIGRIIGLDRAPETRCLRNKIKFLANQNKSQQLNEILINHWYEETDAANNFLYIDGHVRVYFGHQANLPKKYVSRQKLCLNATTEYWVNDPQGMPVMVITGELTEKLEEAIEKYIIPQLQKTSLLPSPDTQDANTPVCNFIFDREAYHPVFFKRLWDLYKIAVITYRKNVKDEWDIETFKSVDVKVTQQNVTMLISEQEVILDNIPFREVRRLTETGHQTSIITNNKKINTSIIAGRMFGRWIQENFFRYMIADYDLDKITEFGIESIDELKQIINPEYRKVDYQLKKHREKTRRLKAKLYPLIEQGLDATIDQMPQLSTQQAIIQNKIKQLDEQEIQILLKRKNTPARITLKEMPPDKRYNKLKHESKMMMNIIKMICYRAETSVANILAEKLARDQEEKRMLVKQIVKNNADIIPDYKNKTLTVILHSLSNNRSNQAVQHLADLLNDTETIFPGTELKLIFKTALIANCEG
jgi:prepilin-type processing-associated H-X9-DG protein